jgi:hypothetical protein
MSNHKSESEVHLAEAQASSTIAGNAHASIKQYIAHMIMTYMGQGDGFGVAIGRRMKLKEVSVNPMVEEPAKEEARLVYEIDVTRGALPVCVNLAG